jgi:hypothetical protein
MRRLRDRTPSSLFRGAELTRLLTLVVMLGVLVLLVDLAAQPSTWRWLVPGDDAADDAQPALTVSDPSIAGKSVSAPEPNITGPTDLDADEQDAIREEFQAVSDKEPLRGEEMPAYWRLMAWEEHQSTAELLKRAQANVTFNELYRRPEAYRGKLIKLRVHLQQTQTANDLADNPLGLSSVDEAWGWNTDSQPYWYWMVTPHLPPGMPQGKDLTEEATFVGYFFKLLPYEDRQGTTRATPLLIGRLIWHPMPVSPLARSREWNWTWYLAGGLAMVLVARWLLEFYGGMGRPRVESDGAVANPQQVESWLDRAEVGDNELPQTPQNGASASNGSAPWEITGPPPTEQR